MMALGIIGADAAGRCENCGGRKNCNRSHTCVKGKCVPKGSPVICGNVYQPCKNGKLPDPNSCPATCPGGKPATPLCGA